MQIKWYFKNRLTYRIQHGIVKCIHYIRKRDPPIESIIGITMQHF
jgi:hypothetical protein